MTTPQVKTQANQSKRKAFTLVELMIVIVIIGILVGISAPIIFGAMNTAKEFTIKNEIFQLDGAVKNFETQYGFYPPAIGAGLEIDSAAKLGPYLNRIAPNHAEGSGGLDAWWDEVGVYLDAESSLVFWLSGLCTSKQYPLSGKSSLGAALVPYNANRDIKGNDLAEPIDRNVFFEFKSGQLVTSLAGIKGIKSYNQPHGKGGSLAYKYRDSKSYLSSLGNAYHSRVDGNGDPVFFNADSFQIIGPGMDGVTTIIELPNTPITNTAILSVTSSSGMDINGDGIDDPDKQDDNITNFSGGRLDLVFE